MDCNCKLYRLNREQSGVCYTVHVCYRKPKPNYRSSYINPLDAIGISLNKQKLMYTVLAPSININSYGHMEALDTLCVRGWLSVKIACFLMVPMLQGEKTCQSIGYAERSAGFSPSAHANCSLT